MNIIVMSEEMIAEYLCHDRHAIISITHPGGNRASMPDNDKRLDVLWMQFHDIEDNPNYISKFLDIYGIEPRPFREQDALLVKEFLEQVEGDIETLICQCEAGISRSAGAAAAISKARTGDDQRFFEWYHPNRLVYKTLLRVLMKGGE